MAVSFGMARIAPLGGSGRLITHLDTSPPSNRRHPIPRIALPIALANTKDTDGEYIVNRRVTSFTNTEEEAVDLTDVVPQRVEDTLIARGGLFSKIEDWAPYAQKDGNLITGQKPASSTAVAKLVLQTMT